MRFAFWPGPTNPWEEVLEAAQHAEASGWDGIYFPDHFMPNQAENSGPTLECWTALAAFAMAVPRVRIGSLVAGNTYRNPALLAKMAANVAIISGGRLVLGIGAGWQENEHAAYDFPFYTVGGRLRRLEEACQVIHSLFRNERTTFEGQYYSIKHAPLAPKPASPPLLLIGGGGERVTLRIAAQYADEWNVWGLPALLAQKMAVLDRHCADLGRNPAEIQRSACAVLSMTEDAALIERTRASGRPVIAGNPDEVAAVIQEYINAGVDEIVIPDWNLGRTLDARRRAMDRFADEVMVLFR